MAELGLTQDEFDDMTPRALIAMIAQWREILIYKAQISAYIANGGKPEELKTVKRDIEYNVANIL
jgi:hypothetical protein